MTRADIEFHGWVSLVEYFQVPRDPYFVRPSILTRHQTCSHPLWEDWDDGAKSIYTHMQNNPNSKFLGWQKFERYVGEEMYQMAVLE